MGFFEDIRRDLVSFPEKNFFKMLPYKRRNMGQTPIHLHFQQMPSLIEINSVLLHFFGHFLVEIC
jgi:hypothetical protein